MIGAEQRAHQGDERVFPATWPRLATEALAVAAIAWGVVAYMYRVWNASLRVPFGPNGDTLFLVTGVKNLERGGWMYVNPDVGAPYGQLMYDYPFGGETLQWVILKLLTITTNSPGLVVNFYFLSSFGILAVIAFLVLRHLRFKTLSSALLALTYTFGAFHLGRGVAHVFLGVAYSVPLACLLLVWMSQWRTRFLVEQVPPTGVAWRANIRWNRVFAALCVCAFIAGWHSYYTIFTIVLLGSAAVLNAIRWRDWRGLIPAALVTATLGLALLAFISPSVFYWLQHGNVHAAARSVQEQEVYGLEPARLLLPSDGSRIEILAKVGIVARRNSPIAGEVGQSLGLVGSAGLIGLLYVALVGFVKRRDHADDGAEDLFDRGTLRQSASTYTLLAILFGTVGGFALITAILGLTQIRAWNRISPFILFFVLIQVAIWGEQFSLWARARARVKYIGAILGATAVLGAAVSAYAGPPAPLPDYPGAAAAWDDDRAFLKQIDDRMPAGAMVMQVPVMPFPENGPLQRMGDYDPFRAYIADDGDLKWSYGAMKGRPESDWQSTLIGPRNQSAELPALLGMGFTGLWVDTYGYTGSEPALEGIRAALAPDVPLVSRNGRFLFYDLRPYKGRLGMTDDQLRRLAEVSLLTTTIVDSGSSAGAQRDPDGPFWLIDSMTATVRVAHNPAALETDQFHGGNAVFTVGLMGSSCGTQKVTLTAPNGTQIVTEVPNGPMIEVSVPVTLDADADTELTLRTDGGACSNAGAARPVLYGLRNPRTRSA